MSWLEEQFEFEYCPECGGDAKHHTQTFLLGQPFAWCLYPRDKQGRMDPIIKAYRVREDAAERERLPAIPD